MEPTIGCRNTLIAREPISRKDIEYVVHRVVDIDYKGCYITQGDNNDYVDDYTPCFYDIKFKIVGVLYE